MRRLLLILSIVAAANFASAQPAGSIRKKISPALAAFKLRNEKKPEQVFWITASNIQSVKNFFQAKKINATIVAEYPATNLLVVKMPSALIDTLLPASFVTFVDIPRTPKEELALGAWDHSVNTINLLHNRQPLLNGKGLTVSIKENEFNVADIDFKGRYKFTSLGSGEESPHATIMATTAAGAGNSFYTGKGAAWGATLSTSSFASLLPDPNAVYTQYDISVQNHSYGTAIENYYGADAAAYDATVIARPSLLHVFSAGNSGNATSGTGKYTGIAALANLTGSFKMAKNIITVGAVDSFAVVAPLSSRGPGYDGRIKPELVAFGQDGSSGAAATTSGIALLLQQAYREDHAGELPPAALVKATLINTADDLETPGPDFISGFGNANAFKAAGSILTQQYFSGNATQGSVQPFDITIPAGLRRFSITLCWSDPPATANAAKALVNDLDLVLQQTNTATDFQPWVLSSFPHKDSLLLPARRTRDSLNNVEKISIDDPPAGNYRILVNGYAVPQGPQPFFIAYHADTANRFYWNHPTATDRLVANEKNILRWESTYDNITTGKLEYSTDKGNNWSVITNATNLQPGFFSWQSPDMFSTILFRITVGSEVYVSDTSTLSKPLNMQVGFNCFDSVLLHWNAAPGAGQYQVFSLGDHYLSQFRTVSDTQIVFRKHSNSSLHYAVAPVTGTANTGIRSHTIDYTLQGVGCYVKNFLADLAGNQSVQLTLELGTLYNVKEIVFEKLRGDVWVSLQTISADSNLMFNDTDNNLHKGGNTYRATIILNNGQRIYSQSITVFHFAQSPYLIFPNPASPHTLLQIHSPDLQPRQLILYDVHGQKVLQTLLTNSISSVSLAALAKGVYFVRIMKEGEKDFTTRLLVQ